MAGSLLFISNGMGRVCSAAGVAKTEPEINQRRIFLLSVGDESEVEVVCQAGRLSMFRSVVGAE